MDSRLGFGILRRFISCVLEAVRRSDAWSEGVANIVRGAAITSYLVFTR